MPAWQPLGETPMHPEYPCAHCISCVGRGRGVARVWWATRSGEITLTSTHGAGRDAPMDPALATTRDEVSNARIWAGFHYRFSTEAGKDMGRKIGELTVATQLRPRK